MIKPTETTDVSAGGPAPAAPTPATDGLDPSFWNQQSGQVNFHDLTKSFDDLKTFKADLRAESVPAEYKLDLPEDVKVSEGLEITFDPKSPTMVEATALAKELGLDQPAFSRFLALDAKRIIREEETSVAEISAEMEKLGQNGPARVQATEFFLKESGLSEREYDAVATIIYSADAVSGFEKIMKRVVSSQMPGGTPPGAAPPPPRQLSRAELFYPNHQPKVN